MLVQLVGGTRRTTARDVAVLRALGARRVQVRRAAIYQAGVVVLVALVVGVTLGVAIGGVAWHGFAERLGAIPKVVIPWTALGVVVGAALVVTRRRRMDDGTAGVREPAR